MWDWAAPTPCTEWDVRQLVNHVVRGNLNYVALLDGGTAAEFLRWREVDALGTTRSGRTSARCGSSKRRSAAPRRCEGLWTTRWGRSEAARRWRSGRRTR
ncbi:maleylpyruvate isomerase N-terminal domain-containing protein [Kutzneria kofuensis]|uniref:maleylpyruvate isomerase N-terminal domain-containing protein n=1 Tax=Kutzneria kofuensis TaxID=103725 RepID=UPI0031F15880